MKSTLLKSTQGTLIAVSLTLIPLGATLAYDSPSTMQQEQTRFPYMSPDTQPPLFSAEPRGAQGPIREDSLSKSDEPTERFSYVSPDIAPTSPRTDSMGAQGPIRDDQFSNDSQSAMDSETRHVALWMNDMRFRGQ